jgi:hypothetical protein
MNILSLRSFDGHFLRRKAIFRIELEHIAAWNPVDGDSITTELIMPLARHTKGMKISAMLTEQNS